ncbi:hypothetical protein WJX73_001010 [Symbiochloris irregularis]|uniref:histone deacetylase n=1 Tax=Symbiochloris irregularis TaxID=706552 RepID=A0AAW1PRB3_9CHLO
MQVKDKKVAYYYDEELGNVNYGGGNPMRPHRVRLTHNLVDNYGLNSKLRVQRPRYCTDRELEEFHADEYIGFLRSVTPDNQEEYMLQMRRFNMGAVGEADCPVFDGLLDYCAMYSGASVGAANLLNSGEADICLNWAGGMHHAKKAEASGFCYINDIVLAILELLKVHQRVLYVDIDIHHGDGVEEAFLLTDRCMTVSFHKYGDFFPGTGALDDTGAEDGHYYSINVPLQEGVDDETYRIMFEPIIAKVMEVYQPGAIVVCGGADSLSGDRLGCFNLSLQGHSHSMEYLASFNVPMLVLGGGGYTMRNVSRCWCYETGRLLGLDLPDELPQAALSQYDYYMDTHRLRISTSNMKNANSRARLEEIKNIVLQNLSRLPPAPGAHMTQPPPRIKPEDELPEEDMDVRGGGQVADEVRVTKHEGYASDTEEETGRARHSQSFQHHPPTARATPPPHGGEAYANGGASGAAGEAHTGVKRQRDASPAPANLPSRSTPLRSVRPATPPVRTPTPSPAPMALPVIPRSAISAGNPPVIFDSDHPEAGPGSGPPGPSDNRPAQHHPARMGPATPAGATANTQGLEGAFERGEPPQQQDAP